MLRLWSGLRHWAPALMAVALLWGAPARADDASEALAFFKDFVARFDGYDTSAAEVYTDNATIRSTRVYPDGTTRQLTMTGSQWKALIRVAMPLARARGDRSTFRNVSARSQGGNVVITAERYSHLKDYTSPYRALLRKDGSGTWKVVEEISETRP